MSGCLFKIHEAHARVAGFCADVWPPGEETGFGTEYIDMPYASSAGYRKHSQIRSRPTYEEPPRLLLLEGEERMWAAEDGKAKAGFVCLALLAILGLVGFCFVSMLSSGDN